MNLDLAIAFLQKIFAHLDELSIDLKYWEIDHLCFRTDSQQSYEEAKKYFSSLSTLLVESEVGGRPIATYKLFEPVIFDNYIIDLIEVPAPKPGRATQKGFEHIEVVIDCSFKDFMDRHPETSFITKGLRKDLNPEIEIEFDDCAIKFHHKSLEHIINTEKNQRITGFLSHSNLMNDLKDFSPCLSGTLPLLIDTKDSDLDILFCAEELLAFRTKVIELFANYPDFTIKETSHQDRPCVVANFTYKDLPIELFAAKEEVYIQQANRHFLVEGRILKIAGKKFRESIIQLKKAGLKTEPAFGQLLELNEPYRELIKLSYLNDREIKQRLNL
jgi:predicted metalloenzyme YecM